MSTHSVLAAEFSATATYTSGQYLLVLYAFVVAAFALFAAAIYGLKTTGEVSKAYRPAAIASTLVCSVATVAYLALILEWVLKFRASPDGQSFAPSAGTVVTELRYMDWSVTVPLLTVEIIAVAALNRTAALRWRTVAMISAALMIVTGYLGVVYGENASRGITWAFWVWGIVSTVFFIVLYVVGLRAYRATAAVVGKGETLVTYRNALILLFSVFGVYPIAYMVPLWTGANDSGWATAEQLAFTAADIAAKVGFGLLIHKAAKLRTAADALAAGGTVDPVTASTLPDDVPGEVWISGQLVSVPTLGTTGAHTATPAR
ncbi:bacteriorhodopsin [uncultured Williamsia sp.]|uniref:bacteriorhodopsin n=1 Tax=uncultured Williamsia sp. TaxID=259311 RepID=UPI00261266F0|nr:bacteriorhodopsin [uncultured Williamsia sp.]